MTDKKKVTINPNDVLKESGYSEVEGSVSGAGKLKPKLEKVKKKPTKQTKKK